MQTLERCCFQHFNGGEFWATQDAKPLWMVHTFVPRAHHFQHSDTEREIERENEMMLFCLLLNGFGKFISFCVAFSSRNAFTPQIEVTV